MAQALQSILDQTHEHLEILVADDGSVDRTRNIIDSFSDSRIRAFHNNANIGYLKTVNQLLSSATGDYICFQDADDWSDSKRIELQLKMIESSGVDACGTGIYYTNLGGKHLKRQSYPAKAKKVRDHLLKGHPAACYASILFSKNVYETMGGYREFFIQGAEDVDWLLRLVEGYTYSNIDDPLYFYRFSPSSITQSTNVLALKASLQVARELALQREVTGTDDLDAGRDFAPRSRYDAIYSGLAEYPLAEDLHKINRLLRRHANWEVVRLCGRVIGKDAPIVSKLEVIFSTIIKCILGIERYQNVRSLIQR